MNKYLKWIQQYRLLVVGVVVASLFVGMILSWQEKPEAAVADFPETKLVSSMSEEEAPAIETKAQSTSEKAILVDVKGAVQKPGLYELKADERVYHAIQAAGGFTEKAEQKSVNLAQKLTDEAVVYVAHQGEEINVVTPQSAAGQMAGSDTVSQKVNLNTATVADLTTISGIGEKRANDIIAYRDSNGGFKTVDDLNNVSGIGDKTMENLRPYVTVE
ncbi:helix-hairpin-helix domain-containing protein [Streptococcus cameli]